MSVWYDKNRKHWVAKFWHDGQPYRKGGFKTKSAGKLWEAETRVEIEREELQAIRTISLRDLTNQYVDHCKATYQKNTYRAKISYYRRFSAWLADNQPDISPEDPADSIPRNTFTQYFDYIAITEGRKNSNRHLKDIKALYNWALSESLLNHSPVTHVPKKGEDQSRRYVPPIEDVNRVLLVANGEEQDLLTCILKVGARLSEILRLTWEDVNLELGTVKLWTRKRRAGGWESRTLKMPKQMHQVIARRHQARNKQVPAVFHRQDGEQWVKDDKWIRHMMDRLCARAGVKRFTFHALRHRIAATLEDSGEATLGMMQEFLGHKRKSTTEDYLKSLDRGAVDLAAIIDAGDDRELRPDSRIER